MWLHPWFLGRVSPFPSGKAQSDAEPSVVEISPLATLRRNSKGKSSGFICSANMLSNSRTASQILLFTQGSAGSGEPSRTLYKTFCCRTGDKQQLSVQTCHLALGGEKLCARHPQLLLSLEHRAFMVSKQILDGSFHICGPETELRKNSLSQEQCLEAQKKTQKKKPNKKSRVLPTLKTKYSP